jgi:hypothetical protein
MVAHKCACKRFCVRVLCALCHKSQVTNDASIFAKQRRHDTNQVEVGSESAAKRHDTKRKVEVKVTVIVRGKSEK